MHRTICRGRTTFLKYHRGRFFGFRVQIRHWKCCPYTVWLEPNNPDANPIVKHSKSSRASAASGRRNTYITPKAARPGLSIASLSRGEGSKNFKQAWRGESFYQNKPPNLAKLIARRLSLAQEAPKRLSVRRSSSRRSVTGNPVRVAPNATGGSETGSDANEMVSSAEARLNKDEVVRLRDPDGLP